jgi:hypothetical protein
MAKYVTYPPQGLLPLPGTNVEFDEGCDVWDMILNASVIVNPAFNPYRIFDVVSELPAYPPFYHCGSSNETFYIVADPMGCTW